MSMTSSTTLIRHAAGPWGMPIGGQRGVAGIGGLSNGTDPTTTHCTIIPMMGGASSVRVITHNLSILAGSPPTSPNSLRISGCVEWPLGSCWPLRWNGAANVTIAQFAIVASDPLAFPTPIPPGSNIRVRLTTFQDGSTKWPLGTLIAVPGGSNNTAGDSVGVRITTTTGNGVNPIVVTTDGNHNFTTGNTCLISNVIGNTAVNGTWTITVLSPTTFSVPATGNGAFAYLNYNAVCIGSDMAQAGSGNPYGQIGSSPIYSPMAVLAVPVINIPGVVGFGNSILEGTGDTLQYPNCGYLERAIYTSFPYVNCSRAGEAANYLVNAVPGNGSNADWLRTTVGRAGDYVVTDLGVNDVIQSRTLAQLQGDLIALWSQWQNVGQRAIQMTVTPHTTSTDGWATATNQATASGETVRTGLNDWLRDGAPLVASGYSFTPSAVGATGSTILRTQYWNGTVMSVPASTGHPLWCVGDAAKLVEVNASNVLTLDGGRWTTTGTANATTTDGLHPTSLVHATLTAAVPVSYMVGF